jgi:hypothetical protein
LAWLEVHLTAKAGISARRAQFLDARVKRVGRDTAHAVLQQAKGLCMAIFQGPKHAHGVPRLEQTQQLSNGKLFFDSHQRFPSYFLLLAGVVQ